MLCLLNNNQAIRDILGNHRKGRLSNSNIQEMGGEQAAFLTSAKEIQL